MNRRHFLLLGLVLLLAGCPITSPERGSVEREGDIVTGTGTVRYYDLEGGFWAIRGDDDVNYDPINLPQEFRSEALRVHFRARIRDDLGSFHMVGPIVEILEISRL